MLKAYLKKMALPTVVMVWAFTYYLECMNYKIKSRRMVSIVFFMMLGLYVINGVTDYLAVRRTAKAKGTDSASADKAARCSIKELLTSSGVGRMVAIFAILVAYVLLLDPVGFILTTLVCSCLVMVVMGERKWYMLVLMPVALVIILYLVFNLGLRVPLPKGILPIL